MEHLSKRIKNLSESQTIAMNQKSKDMQAQGIDVINLSVGEPDFFTPDHIKEAAKKAVDDNFSFYSPVPGYPELRKAISEKFKRENNLDYAPEQIVVSNGAKHSLANALLALVDAGDEVIVPAPYWVSYAELVKLSEGKNIILETSLENDFKITPDQLKNAITPNTKAILICSPSNPTGSIYTKDELEALAKVVAPHERIFIITDEIYEHINFVGKHESFAQFDFIKDRVVTINGVSKGYAMTGYRIGYMGAPAWLAKACTKLQGQVTTGPSSIAQQASIAALNSPPETTEKMRVVFQRRRDLIMKLLGEIPGVKFNTPAGAFYIFPDVSAYYGKSDGKTTINNSTDFCIYLLENAHIATVPGEAFGEPKCIRISFATSDEKLEAALKAFKTAAEKLN